MNKYRVATVSPAGNDWYHVLVIGPKDIHLPIKWQTQDSEEKIRERAEAWCDRQNRWLGIVDKKEGEAMDEYKRRSTILHERMGKRHGL